MEKIYVIRNRDVLSCRRQGEFHFHNRTVDEVEMAVFSVLAELEDADRAASQLAHQYQCQESEVRERIKEISQDIFQNSDLLLSAKVIMWERMVVSPVHIIAELTNSCNMGCAYCYGDFGGLDRNKDLALGNWLEILSSLLDSELVSQGAQLLNLTGGEPTLHPNIVEILEFTSGKFDTALFTNCQLLTREVYEALRRHQSLVRINTSFDSHKRTVDEEWRGCGFEMRIANLRRLDDLGVNLSVNIGVGRHNLLAVPKTVRYFASEFENVSVLAFPLDKQGRANSLPDSFFVSQEEYINLAQQTREDVAGWSARVSFEPPPRDDQIDLKGNHMCNLGQGVVTIDPRGIAKPCTRPCYFFEQIGADYFCVNMLQKRASEALPGAMGRAQLDVPLKDAQEGCVLPNLLNY